MKVLLAVDHTEQSASAIVAVSHRILPAGSILRVLSVVEDAGPPPVGDLLASAGGDLAEYHRQRVTDVANLTNDIAASLRAHGLAVETAVRGGKAAETIVEEAKQWQADLIVMGSHGYTGIKRLFLGSVAEWVVSHAPCSVEIVRDPPQSN